MTASLGTVPGKGGMWWRTLLFRVGPAVCFLGVMFLVSWQAEDERWSCHLGGDARVFSSRVDNFKSNGSWGNLDFNEYQPGALAFFLAVGTGLEHGDPDVDFTEQFVRRLRMVNAALLVCIFGLALLSPNKWSGWLFVLFVFCTGPLLLYRFELLTSVLTIVGLFCFQRGLAGLGGFLFGLGGGTKIYPALIPFCLPWEGWRRAASMWVGVAAGVAVPVILYFHQGGDLTQIRSALEFHAQKPVGVDGPYGTFLTFLEFAGGTTLEIAPRNGVSGVDSDSAVLSAIADWSGVLIVLGFLLFTKIRYGFKNSLWQETGYIFTAVFLFSLLNKASNPQYVWWGVSLLPFVNRCWFRPAEWVLVTALVGIALLGGQWVYPLHYSDFLEWYKSRNGFSLEFWVNSAKNLMLVTVAIVAARAAIRNAANGDWKKNLDTPSP